MTDILDQDARREVERAERQQQKLRAAQLRADVQAVMATESGRRLAWAFLQEAAIDLSPFRLDPTAMAHAVAWQDAGRWWLQQIRDHCPERETDMRAEARRDARTGAQGNDDADE